jgi:hypothetical protein
MSEDENALVTDHYVISPYCLQGDRTKEVYILKGHGKREWWYSPMMARRTSDGLHRPLFALGPTG